MTWERAKEAFINGEAVGYKGGIYTVVALVNRKNRDGLFIRQVELSDLNGNSAVVVNENFIEELDYVK